ncbi:2OG-Fe dioxygenase family protein [Amphritea pacifica]|uniref:2OG-Fe dioxygenase family protein n=1 Tax=Amphritea pacifica TaxID=2811233 RepID=UPI001965442D|nr:2OG-Fe dioxygenase family protein [Amphritea pacifica]MBN1009145.1 2OG-Fe dioxygenase family protein [Amphritea pacifica]
MKALLTRQDCDSVVDHSNGLKNNYFTVIHASEMQSYLGCSAKQVQEFIDEWQHLTLDTYMGDGGTYRYRRYGQLDKMATSNSLTLLPHQAYEQSKEVNYLNGDIARWFDPLTSSFVNSQVLQSTLLFLANLYDQTLGQATDWNIRLHPYRIVASTGQLGQPAPEGLHRDGVTYIASMMIQRQNASGGVTTLTDNQRQLKSTIELAQTFDIVIADDDRAMHDVSAVCPVNDQALAIRDVLVIAFTKKESEA